MERAAPRALAGLAAALLALSPARAEEFKRLEYHFAATGPTRILSGWTCWFADCKYADCHMTTLQRPKLGALRPVASSGVIPAPGGRCARHPAPVLAILYTPRPGAHGADEVTLRSIADNGGRHILHFHIDVP